MPVAIRTNQNDTVDALCWRFYGRTVGVTEAVLSLRAIVRAQPESRLASGRRFSSCAMVQAFRMRQSE